MSGDADAALNAVLHAVAEVVLTRPHQAGLAREPERMVAEQSKILRRALEKVPGVRARVADLLAERSLPDRAEPYVTLLVHPDAEVVRTGLVLCDATGNHQRDRAAARSAERLERKVADLRSRLERAEGRLEHARREISEKDRRLVEVGGALAEYEDRLVGLEERQGIERIRWKDPHALAAALLGVLEPLPPKPRDDAASRDPRVYRSGVAVASAKATEATADSRDRYLEDVARTVKLDRNRLLDVLRAMVDPTPPCEPTPATVRELDLRITPLGAGTEIGGSCLLVEAGDTRLLVDAGTVPRDGAPPPDIDRALAGPLHGVVVTHAHNDHCGYVPALVARRPDLRVLATPETVQLMPVMWTDTVKVTRGRDRVWSEWGADSSAHYGHAEVRAAVGRCEEVPFGARRRIGDLTIELFPAGHILGAAGVVVRAGDRRAVITGDISGFAQESVDGYRLPESAPGADLLVMESTCCGENHGDRTGRVHELIRSVAEIYEGGGRVLIPAFALGRAQEVALILRRHLPDVPVRIDGMATDLAHLFESATAGSERPLEIFGGAVAVADRPRELETFRTGVIVSTSGMLTGGPAVQWARHILPEPGSALFVSGYQDEESPGAELLRLAGQGGGEFALMDRDEKISLRVLAKVATMRLSAHADRGGLLEIADGVAAAHVMLVHGMAGRQRRFAEVLGHRGHRVVRTEEWRAG
ncbi:MBL fold metallo-hydrolase [Spirillospora sp. NPDC049652]